MTRILVVCTGNVCRSPFAQHYLQTGFDSLGYGDFTVESAGTFALVDEPMSEPTARRLSDRGIDPHSFRARQITLNDIKNADIVLTMTLEHRLQVLQEAPAALKRTFTLREFAHLLKLLSEDDASSLSTGIVRGSDSLSIAQRWRGLRQVLSSLRGTVRVEEPDVTDPYQQGEDVYDTMVQEMLPAMDIIVRAERNWRG